MIAAITLGGGLRAAVRGGDVPRRGRALQGAVGVGGQHGARVRHGRREHRGAGHQRAWGAHVQSTILLATPFKAGTCQLCSHVLEQLGVGGPHRMLPCIHLGNLESALTYAPAARDVQCEYAASGEGKRQCAC